MQYSLIISPGGQKVPVYWSNCNFSHCSYTYTTDGSITDYTVSLEAVGCVTRTRPCQNISSRKLCNVVAIISYIKISEGKIACLFKDFS